MKKRIWILLSSFAFTNVAFAGSRSTNILKAFECKVESRRVLIFPTTGRLGDQRYYLKHLFAESNWEIFAKLEKVNFENDLYRLKIRADFGGFGKYLTAEVNISEVDGKGSVEIRDYSFWRKSNEFYKNGEAHIDLKDCRSVRYRFALAKKPWILEKPFDWSRPDDSDDTGNYY